MFKGSSVANLIALEYISRIQTCKVVQIVDLNITKQRKNWKKKRSDFKIINLYSCDLKMEGQRKL